MKKNSTSFPAELQELLEQALNKSELSDKLFYYQKLVVLYVGMISRGEIEGVKGLLVWHQMGLGKTILAIAIADVLLASGYIVKIVTPKSLSQNFKDGVDKYNAMLADVPEFRPLDKSKFKFLTKSNTIMKQLSADDDLAGLTKVFEDDRNEYVIKKIEKNTVIIFDESHQFSQLVANGSPQYVTLYNTIMTSPNAIFIGLSGSLFSSNPFELAVLINVASGQTLLPESEDEFMKQFWDSENGVMKNRGKFQNRCFGLVSRMKLGFLETDTQNLYPKEHQTQIVRCPMSNTQIDAYVTARGKEIKEAKFSGERLGKPSTRKFESNSKMSSTYRVVSRQYSNFGPIPEMIELKNKYPKGETPREKIIEVIKNTSDEYFHNGKFLECYGITESHPGRKGLIMSQFTDIGGALSIAEGYSRKGYKQVMPGLKYTPGKNFAVINGSVDIEDQNKILKLFYSEENIDASIIHFLIIGLQQAMGLDVPDAKFVIMYEPYWVYLIWDQLKKRINRYKSHERLPVEERETFPYILLSVYPPGMDEKTINAYGMKKTTDEHLYMAMIKNKEQMKAFKMPIEEVAIECGVIKKKFPDKVCRMCEPNGRELYTYGKGNFVELLKYDCNREDPCNTETTSVKAKKVTIHGREYYKVEDKTSDFGYMLYEKVGSEFRELSYSEMVKLK